MNPTLTIFKREFMGYFRSPVAYVFLAVFLIAAVGAPWFLGGFFDNNLANLDPFFQFLPWVFLFLIPAAGMRLWSEEKRSGTRELLFTLPISVSHAVIGKFLAGWVFISLALALTLSMPLTLAYLGTPDWGPVITGYAGAILMAGAYLGICSVASSLTKNQVIAFVVGVVFCLLLVFLGWSLFNDLLLSMNLPTGLVDALANFSFITHFESMGKGLVRIKDLVFFLSLIGFCLCVNILVLESRHAINRLNKCMAFGLIAAGLVLANTLGSLIRGEADLTEDKLYTLSPGSLAMLARVEQPLTLRFYYSRGIEAVPIQFKNYAARVEDFLAQYEKEANGMVRLEVINPRPDTPEEEDAIRGGVSGKPMPTGETLFFGLRAIQADQERVIPVFTRQRQDFLEFDVSRLIHQVQQLDLPKLGIVSGLDVLGDSNGPGGLSTKSAWAFVRELSDNFEVQRLGEGAFPADLDVLAVIHPQDLDESLLVDIERVLLSGKPVFMAVDPSSQVQKDQQDPAEMQTLILGGKPLPITSDVPRLFRAWGIEYNDQTVVGDFDLAASVTGSDGQVVRYPVWLTVENFDQDFSVTSQLGELLLPEPGHFRLADDSALEMLRLATASSRSAEISTSVLSQAVPDVVNQHLKPDGTERVLAAMVRGRFSAAFPKMHGDLVPADESTLILIADTDFLSDRFSVRIRGEQGLIPINDNVAFINNAIEYLAGSGDLIDLRSRGSVLRPFDRIRDMERAAQAQYVERLKVLEERLAEVREKLRDLEGRQRDQEKLVASPAARKMIEEFRSEEADLRAEHRSIRKRLREDIEQLKLNLALLNLLPVPVLVGLFGINFFIFRTRKQKR